MEQKHQCHQCIISTIVFTHIIVSNRKYTFFILYRITFTFTIAGIKLFQKAYTRPYGRHKKEEESQKQQGKILTRYNFEQGK